MQIAEILIAATAYYCHWELFESLTDFRCLIVGSYEKYLAFLPVSRFARYRHRHSRLLSPSLSRFISAPA